MKITKTSACEIKEKLNSMLGLTAWNASLGEGSFITCEFGNALPPNEDDVVYGEWHLWVYCCSWRLEQGGEMVVGSGDPPTILEQAVRVLNNLKLLSVEIFSPTGDAIFEFEQEISLRLFSIYSSECESWIIFTPNAHVLTIGPGTQWLYERDQPLSS